MRSRRMDELIVHAMIEQNDAVGDVFFQAFTRQCTFPRSAVMIVVTPFFFSQ